MTTRTQASGKEEDKLAATNDERFQEIYVWHFRSRLRPDRAELTAILVNLKKLNDLLAECDRQATFLLLASLAESHEREM